MFECSHLTSLSRGFAKSCNFDFGFGSYRGYNRAGGCLPSLSRGLTKKQRMLSVGRCLGAAVLLQKLCKTELFSLPQHQCYTPPGATRSFFITFLGFFIEKRKVIKRKKNLWWKLHAFSRTKSAKNHGRLFSKFRRSEF